MDYSNTKRRFKTSEEDTEVDLHLPLPPVQRWYNEYDQVYFHLAQAPGLSTALTETYGEITSVQSKRRLSKFLAETTEQSYISSVGERLFSQQASATLEAELLSLCDDGCTTPLGCNFLVSLLPKYCERFRTLHPKASNESESRRDEDEIIQSFLAEINSLRLPGEYWWLIMMRKYSELYQTLHSETPKDVHLLWVEEDEMIASERLKREDHLNRFFQLGRYCMYCNDPRFEGMGGGTCEPKAKFSQYQVTDLCNYKSHDSYCASVVAELNKY